MQKEIKKQLDNILNQPAPDKIKAQLQNLGLSEKDINNQTAIAVALYQQALKGNINAINTINKMAETVELPTVVSKRENREKYVKKEVKRLTKLFETIPDDQKEVVKQLIQNAGFMSATLDELMNTINENGIKEEYKNGANQFGYKDSVEVKTYNAMIKNYMAVIKQLNDLLPNQNNLKDEFDRFCEEI